MAFIKKEKRPIVTKLRGNDIKFNSGLTTRNNNDNTNPPIIKVINPPETFNPEIAWDRIKSERALNSVFLSKDFINYKYKCYQNKFSLSIK